MDQTFIIVRVRIDLFCSPICPTGLQMFPLLRWSIGEMPLGLQWYFLLASGEELETKLSSHHSIQGLHDTFMTATGNPLIFQNKLPDSGSQAYGIQCSCVWWNQVVSFCEKKTKQLEFVSVTGFFYAHRIYLSTWALAVDLQTAVNVKVDILSWRTTSLMLIGNHAWLSQTW